MSHLMRTQSAYAKTKTQISFAVTAKLISAFVFATRIVHFLFFLNPKFQASSLLLCLYSLICVRPVRKSPCWFSHEIAQMTGPWITYNGVLLKTKSSASEVQSLGLSESDIVCLFQRLTLSKSTKCKEPRIKSPCWMAIQATTLKVFTLSYYTLYNCFSGYWGTL